MSDVEETTAAPEAVEVTDSAPAKTGGKMTVEDALQQVLKNSMVCLKRNGVPCRQLIETKTKKK